MDPNETLKRIHEFLTDKHIGKYVDIWCEHLYQWIKNGGFKPEWGKYELGTSYYKTRKVYMDRADYAPVETNHGRK